MKRCSVACDTPEGILACELELPEGATIALALVAARRLLGESATDWERAATGIWGKVHPREHVPLDGDRIELYRPLKVDARASRRLRAARSVTAARARSGRSPTRGR